MKYGMMVLFIGFLMLSGSCSHHNINTHEMTGEERLFRSKCRSCHTLPDPASRSEKAWIDLMEQHSSRLKLSEEEQQKIIHYFQKNTKTKQQ